MPAPPQPYPDRASLFEAFAQHVSRGKIAAFRALEFDAVMGERSGSYFHDAYSERRWLNCHCNGGVFNLGHRNPRVLEAVRRALDTLDVGNHHLASGYRAQLAERLSATTDGRLPGVVFGVAGGEAIDLAIKVCRAATGRQEILSAAGGYHGHTGLAVAAGDPKYRDPFGPNLPGFRQVPFDDLPAMEAAISNDTAAVILEPIPATLGMPIAREGYLRGVQALCRKVGAKLIIDEVQTGLGRTGRMWCYQLDDLEPDAVVTGKGLSGGVYPITATLMTRELHRLFDRDPFVHVSTFGGAEPGCAAGLAVLDAVEAPGFLDRVNALAARFREGLAGMPFELRQRGLMMGLKFAGEAGGVIAAKLVFENGLFALYANNDDTVLQLLPPLTSSDEEVREMIRILRSALA